MKSKLDEIYEYILNKNVVNYAMFFRYCYNNEKSWYNYLKKGGEEVDHIIKLIESQKEYLLAIKKLKSKQNTQPVQNRQNNISKPAPVSTPKPVVNKPKPVEPKKDVIYGTDDSTDGENDIMNMLKNDDLFKDLFN